MITDPYALIKELADELEAVLHSKSVRQILQTHQNQK
jgi:AAA15 family ATPase/GTPase